MSEDLPDARAPMTVHEESVPAAQWIARCRDVRGSGATMFDFLTAVDRVVEGELEVIVHLVDVAARDRWIVVTRVDRGRAELDSLAGLYLGADWHEREVAEMFGITFLGHPDPRPLLTTGPVGHPLRRTTPLPVRVGTAWPGAAGPGDSAGRASGGAPGPARPAAAGSEEAQPRDGAQPAAAGSETPQPRNGAQPEAAGSDASQPHDTVKVQAEEGEAVKADAQVTQRVAARPRPPARAPGVPPEWFL